MDGSGHDADLVLPGDYCAGAVLSHRESRLVLRVTRTDTGAARILKCLVPPFPAVEEGAFRSEFLLLDALRHPCWVRPLRFGSLASGGYFLEMEEAPGVTLSRWPVRGWWPETLAIAHQVLSGLEVLHRLGYAHLDLGPEQVLVESTETPTPWDAAAPGTSTRARLLDLGLAAPFGAAIGARGTPGSIAPELLQSRSDWDARVDLYGVGTILFELFTGRPAFPGRTVREVLARQLEGSDPDPGEEAGLPPPVRDLVRELLARDPAARPRSALETWQRLREQAPRAGVGALPPFLISGEEFAFIGRDAEIAAFDAWISTMDPATVDGRYELSGEQGIGCRRLAARLGAVAESHGWVRSGDAAAPVLHHPRGGTVRISVRSADNAQASMESHQSAPSGTAIGLAVEPMQTEDLERILAAVGIESDILRRRLASSCLGSPGLLAGLFGVLPREVDFATRHAGEDRLDATLDRLPVPASWLDWSRRLLGQLSPADGSALLRAGVAGVPGMPEGVALGPPALPAVLDSVAHRGLLESADGSWRVPFGLWARAIVGADDKRTAAIGRELFADLNRSGDDVTRARLGLLLHDTDAVAIALPGALNSLAALGRREEAVLLHAEASRLGPAALRGLGEQEILGLLEGMFGLGTRGGSLLDEPAGSSAVPPAGAAAPEGVTGSEPPGAAAARALLETWAWLGRQRTDRAAAALQAVGHLRPESWKGDPRIFFFRGWLQFRLLQATIDPNVSPSVLPELQELRALRELLSPAELRRQAWCDAAEAAILDREGRCEEALGQVEDGSARLSALEAGEQATYLYVPATIRYRRGELRSAAELLGRAEALWRGAGFAVNRLNAAGGIASIALQEGNLPRAQAWHENLLREWTERGRWNEASTALGNLAVTLLERGRLGESLQAGRDATALAERGGDPLAAQRVAKHNVHLLVRAGLVVRAEEEAVRYSSRWESTAPSSTPVVLSSLGESLFAQRRLEEGCTQFRRAVTGFLATGSGDDAADTLAQWGLAEAAAGRTAEARDRMAEIESMRPETTGLTRSAIALLEAEIGLVPTADQSVGNALETAARAVAVLETQDRWSFAWRAHWCLARGQKASGRAREALASYETARVILTGIAESFGTVARTDGYLQLPAVRSFLDDLGRA
jgi:tetratricopeptide (TPR) repeat protein